MRDKMEENRRSGIAWDLRENLILASKTNICKQKQVTSNAHRMGKTEPNHMI
jgi:hypothetical protein